MRHLTLAEALRLPAFRRAVPVVVAGEDAIERPIRWVHATELADVAGILRPGDLVLTMGTGLPADGDHMALADFVQTLADVESAGLVIELGRRWQTALPQALIDACRERAIPLVALTHEVKFASLTQTIGERIIDAQLADLRDAQRVHDTFTELSFTQAGPAEILDAVQRLTGGPVVLENAQHRPLDFLAGSADGDGFLDGWQTRSARVTIAGRTGWDAGNGWLVTRLGTTEQDWGRLVIASPEPPAERDMAVAERAAAALALHRLHDRDRENSVRRTHRELMSALQAGATSDEVLRRCELARFPVRRRNFLALVLRPRTVTRAPTDLNDVAATAVRAAHAARVPVLVCEVERDIRVLLSTTPSTSADAVADRVARRIVEQHDVAVAAGRVAGDLAEIGRSLREAGHVADAIPLSADPTSPAVHRLEDLHLRGLLALLGQDDRLRLFTDRELQRLREHDRSVAGRPSLIAALRALLTHPESKTHAAASLHLSRAAFYDRLAKIAQVLGRDLDDPEVRISLHVALIADEMSAERT
ncbi:PucR family transcriptional regulator ligand-binding domain-containing protein [Nocardioides sp. CER19]|uniref:PucR family transcriptional regulator n=1 Tax=Nocardioides sp. CER19 TaxID=3038538 RepID=UPI0024470CB8|nr:PucR family transcriptional regulator ligand-binding domain-containing protein [Nocardioides sp. CER19]MDH2416175.1 PucR family transcriptional regulator ligand-binding domain-containing protein [Nocardioides sp. CER19]